MKSMIFVVPAFGRLNLTRICLGQLRRTCDALQAEGVHATAIIVADDENLDTARNLGFGIVRRDNEFTSRRFNDGLQAALDPDWNKHPADYVVPFGSDDWVDHRIFLDLPPADTMVGFQRLSFVREDGAEIGVTALDNKGGCGIRIYPRQLLAPLGYRPADEDRTRACDTSILVNVQKTNHSMQVAHRHLHDRQIVDWKSDREQLNSYGSIAARHRIRETTDPFEALAGIYPAEALDEVREHYARRLVAA